MHSPYPRPHLADHVTTAVVVLTQTLIGVFLWKDLRPRVSKPVFKAAAATICFLWFIVAGGMWIDAFDEGLHQYPIPSAFLSFWLAVANLWSIPAVGALAVYLIYRFI